MLIYQFFEAFCDVSRGTAAATRAFVTLRSLEVDEPVWIGPVPCPLGKEVGKAQRRKEGRGNNVQGMGGRDAREDDSQAAVQKRIFQDVGSHHGRNLMLCTTWREAQTLEASSPGRDHSRTWTGVLIRQWLPNTWPSTRIVRLRFMIDYRIAENCSSRSIRLPPHLLGSPLLLRQGDLHNVARLQPCARQQSRNKVPLTRG